MATTTPNFGWDVPQSTDLVKDGATAIAALGNDIDTSLVDLKGGTTGQVLSKASNTDMDFTWSSVDPLTILDAKADLITATAADTPARLAVGTNNQVVMADSTTATGLKYANEATATLTTTGDLLYASAANTLARRGIGATGDILTVSGGVPVWSAPATSGTNWVSIGSASLTGAQTVTISGISSRQKIAVYINGGSSATGSATIGVRFNGDTGSNYNYHIGVNVATSTANNMVDGTGTTSGDHFPIYKINTGGSGGSGTLYLDGGNTTGVKSVFWGGAGAAGASTSGMTGHYGGGFWNNSATITSVSVWSSSGNLDGGLMYVYASTNQER